MNRGDGANDHQQKRARDEEIGKEIRRRSMVVGRYLPESAQGMRSSHPETTPPRSRTPTPPVGFDPTLDQTSDSPGTLIPWSRSNTPPPHPSVTPCNGRLRDTQNTPQPGPSRSEDWRRYDDHEDHSEDNPPTRKRQKRTRTRQKEDPVSLLTAAIERNTKIVEQQHRESQGLLERTTQAQQKMFNDLMGALRN